MNIEFFMSCYTLREAETKYTYKIYNIITFYEAFMNKISINNFKGPKIKTMISFFYNRVIEKQYYNHNSGL